MNKNWKVFEIWAEIQEIDLERLDAKSTDSTFRSFLDEKKHESFNYNKALRIFEGKENPLIKLNSLNTEYTVYGTINIKNYISKMEELIPKVKKYIQDYEDGKFNSEG